MARIGGLSVCGRAFWGFAACFRLLFDIVILGRDAWAAAVWRALADVFFSKHTFVQCAFLCLPLGSAGLLRGVGLGLLVGY